MAGRDSCESLTKSFTSRPLFENLTFAIAAGDHIGLIGPNGSGKSTLLKIVAGIEQPDSGTRAVRKGARRLRAAGRGLHAGDVNTAGKLIDELQEGRDRARVATARIDFTASDRKTKRLWVGKGLRKAGLFRNLDLLLL